MERVDELVCRGRTSPPTENRMPPGAQRESQAHRRVEVSARCRCEDQDEHRQHGAGCERVAEQRQREVTSGKPLRHDPGADNGGEQECGSERFAENASGERRHQLTLVVAPSMRPISLSFDCS